MDSNSAPKYHLNIGELIVCPEPSVISTVLGSCVSVCLYSPKKNVGAMIHYAHPRNQTGASQNDDLRYGDVALPALILHLAAVTGELPSAFIAKIVGGASEIVGERFHFDVGHENILIAKNMLAQNGIQVVSQETGGNLGRKVLFHTATHRVQVSKIQASKRARVEAKMTSCDFRKILAIGASTGGTAALTSLMTMLPKEIPPTLIVQHIPPSFSGSFAERLNELCPFEVKEAEDRDEVRASRVLIAPGGRHMRLEKLGPLFRVRLSDDLPVNRHKPSVDVLFKSVASLFGASSVGVLLTGMGDDGARGLLEMRVSGAKTIAQDESTSVVYGMPRAACALGAVDHVLALERIPAQIVKLLASKTEDRRSRVG